MTIFDFFKIRFLGFYKPELKSEDIFNSGGSGLSEDIHFVGFRLSFHALSPLPIVLSKHFNHPHPYIEIATTISDNNVLHVHIIQWNGNTDGLHSNSYFCCFTFLLLIRDRGSVGMGVVERGFAL